MEWMCFTHPPTSRRSWLSYITLNMRSTIIGHYSNWKCSFSFAVSGWGKCFYLLKYNFVDQNNDSLQLRHVRTYVHQPCGWTSSLRVSLYLPGPPHHLQFNVSGVHDGCASGTFADWRKNSQGISSSNSNSKQKHLFGLVHLHYLQHSIQLSAVDRPLKLP